MGKKTARVEFAMMIYLSDYLSRPLQVMGPVYVEQNHVSVHTAPIDSRSCPIRFWTETCVTTGPSSARVSTTVCPLIVGMAVDSIGIAVDQSPI